MLFALVLELRELVEEQHSVVRERSRMYPSALPNRNSASYWSTWRRTRRRGPSVFGLLVRDALSRSFALYRAV